MSLYIQINSIIESTFVMSQSNFFFLYKAGYVFARSWVSHKVENGREKKPSLCDNASHQIKGKIPWNSQIFSQFRDNWDSMHKQFFKTYAAISSSQNGAFSSSQTVKLESIYLKKIHGFRLSCLLKFLELRYSLETNTKN